MLIVDDLLTLPVKGFFGLFQKIRDMAEDELYNPEKIKATLDQLNETYEAGEIDKQEFQKEEQGLLQRLEIGTEKVRKHK